MLKRPYLYCLVAVATAAAGCKKSVPAPWSERGVPGDWLTEIFAGTSSERYSAVYDQDPRGVIVAFRSGLAKGGFSQCGEMVVDGTGSGPKQGTPPFEATAFLKKDAAIWRVRALEVDKSRTQVTVEEIPAKTISFIRAQQAAQKSNWEAWHSQLARSGCLSLSETKSADPGPVPTSTPSASSSAIEGAVAAARHRPRTIRRSVALPTRGKSARASAIQADGRLWPEAQRVVRQNSGRIRFCYEKALRTNPALRGNVVVKLVVDASGAVTTALDGGSDIADQAVVSCVLQCFKRMRFSEPRERSGATFVHSLRFDPS